MAPSLLWTAVVGEYSLGRRWPTLKNYRRITVAGSTTVLEYLYTASSGSKVVVKIDLLLDVVNPDWMAECLRWNTACIYYPRGQW